MWHSCAYAGKPVCFVLSIRLLKPIPIIRPSPKCYARTQSISLGTFLRPNSKRVIRPDHRFHYSSMCPFQSLASSTVDLFKLKIIKATTKIWERISFGKKPVSMNAFTEEFWRRFEEKQKKQNESNRERFCSFFSVVFYFSIALAWNSKQRTTYMSRIVRCYRCAGSDHSKINEQIFRKF